MLNKIKINYIKNKLINSIKIKKKFKNSLITSIINNKNLLNYTRVNWLIKRNLNNCLLTKINDICLNAGVYKKASNKLNLSRHEFHKLCRTNKLASWVVNSW